MAEQKIVVIDLGSAEDMELAKDNADWIMEPEQRAEEMRIIDESLTMDTQPPTPTEAEAMLEAAARILAMGDDDAN